MSYTVYKGRRTEKYPGEYVRGGSVQGKCPHPDKMHEQTVSTIVITQQNILQEKEN